MRLIDARTNDGTLTIWLEGHVDSSNAAEVEREVTEAREAAAGLPVVIDCSRLEYISSAGLRVILRLRKETADLRLIEVSSEVYEVFDMTGFTEMLDITKAYRVISVDGCEAIGQGANGKVYRIDPDTIVKVYLNPDALPEIHRERELARTAFVLGIPTAIPYDVVRVGEGYGSVFELLNATSYAKLLARGEMGLDEVVGMSVELLKLIHSTTVKPESMPSMRDVAVGWAHDLEAYLPEELYGRLCGLIEGVPEDLHMMHGDYHIKNVMLQNGESLLIDMDTLCHGHPVFELASMFNAYVGYGELDHDVIPNFLGIPFETSCEFWDKSLRLYLADGSADVEDVREKAMIVGYTRMMRRSIRRGGLDTPDGQAFVDHCRQRLEELVPRHDTLVF